MRGSILQLGNVFKSMPLESPMRCASAFFILGSFLFGLVGCADGGSTLPNSSIAGTSAGHETQASKGQPGLTRSAGSTVRTGFAGFGRVGRAHQGPVDYRARWAVIVGVNRFEHMPRLKNACNDALAVRNMLRDEFGYHEDRIIYLVDEVEETEEQRRLRSSFAKKRITLLDPINKSNLIKAFDDLSTRDIRPDDAVLVFFAGHGLSKSGAFIAGYDSDPDDLTTWVNANELKKRLAAINARHKLLILDSCYAGSILEVDLSKNLLSSNAIQSRPPNPTTANPSSRGGTGEAFEIRDNLAYYLREPTFLAITSGRNEAVSDGKGNSPFTAAMLNVMRERANSSREGDVFTARELAVRVESTVSKGQTPDWGRLGGGRGDFVFRPTVDRMTPRENAERDNYAVRITLADIKIKDGKLAKAKSLLDGCPTRLRHFEWHRLYVHIDESHATLRTVMPVPSVDISADGKDVAFKDGARMFYHWKPSQRAVTLIDKQGGGHLRQDSVAINGDGQRMALKTEFSKILVFALDRPQPISMHDFFCRQNGLHAIAMSANGKRIATGGQDKPIFIWNAEKGDKPIHVLNGHNAPPRAVAINADGSRVASSSFDKTIKVWETTKGDDPIHTLMVNDSAGSSINSSDSGTIVVYNEGNTVKAWDVNSKNQRVNTYTGSTEPLHSVAMSGDGSHIVAAGDDHLIRVWAYDRPGSALFTFRGHQEVVRSVAMTRDGSIVVSGGDDKTVKLWKLNQGGRNMVLKGHQNEVAAAAVSPDGSRIVSAAGSIKVWNGDRQGSPYFELPGHEGGTTCVAYDAENHRIVSAGVDKVIRVWSADRAGKPLLELGGHDGEVTSIALSSDGERIVSGSADKSVRIWNAKRRGQPLMTLTGHTNKVTCVAISRDGNRVAAGSDAGIIKIWDVNQGGEALQSINARYFQSTQIRSVAFNPDGTRLVTGGADWRIRVWRTSGSEKPLHTLLDHAGPINATVFSNDGKRIFSASQDGTIKVWESDRSAEPLLTMQGHAGAVSTLAVGRNGKRIVTGGVDRTLRVWNTAGWPR